MKKILAFLMMFAMSFSIVGAAEYNLYADQNIPVGNVDVTNDGENIHVTYDITADGWCLAETHLHLASSMSALPNAGGKMKNLVPGRFAYSNTHEPCITEYTYEIPLGVWAPTNNVLVAAHAEVELWDEYESSCGMVPTGAYDPMTSDVVSDVTTEYVSGAGMTPAVAAWVHPAWTSAVNIPGATWIWTGEYVTPAEARNGASYTFEKKFDLPADAANIAGQFWITTDNSYELYVNGELVGSDVDWMSVETYDVGSKLTQGTNTIRVVAVNAPWDTDDPMSNPGGLLYKLTVAYGQPLYEEVCVMVPYMVDEETAWGATGVGTTRYNTKGNWATYFTYVVELPPV